MKMDNWNIIQFFKYESLKHFDFICNVSTDFTDHELFWTNLNQLTCFTTTTEYRYVLRGCVFFFLKLRIDN